MGDKSKIQWTDATWNVTYGCTRASRGCDNCYAVKVTQRLAGSLPVAQGLVGKGHFNGTVRTLEDRLDQPLRWKRPRRIFVNSLSDLFHREVPFAYIDRVFAVMALTPRHTYQILTKRPERMAEYVRERTGGPVERPRWPLPNVWLGTSVEDQERADERIPHLLRTPAAVRFLSCEPLLGPVDLTLVDWDGATGLHVLEHPPRQIDWVIAGGESGPGARDCDVAWIRSIVRQCADAGVACFVKQLGARPVLDDGHPIAIKDSKGGDWDEWPADDLRVREMPR